jgi:hypothetical protein
MPEKVQERSNTIARHQQVPLIPDGCVQDKTHYSCVKTKTKTEDACQENENQRQDKG